MSLLSGECPRAIVDQQIAAPITTHIPIGLILSLMLNLFLPAMRKAQPRFRLFLEDIYLEFGITRRPLGKYSLIVGIVNPGLGSRFIRKPDDYSRLPLAGARQAPKSRSTSHDF